MTKGYGVIHGNISEVIYGSEITRRDVLEFRQKGTEIKESTLCAI